MTFQSPLKDHLKPGNSMLRRNSFLITVSAKTSLHSTDYFCDEHVRVEFCEPNNNYIIYEKSFDEGFCIFFGERKDEPSLDYANPINGTSIIYRSGNKELKVIADQVGSEYLFYKQTDKSLFLSNRLENLLEKEDKPNWTSIQCFLSLGYTLKCSTFFKNIFQTLPYQKITISVPDIQTKKEYYVPDPPCHHSSNSVSSANLFASRFTKILNEYKPMVLMMSAGWDSRTILAPKNSPVVAAYTHGDLSSRETFIAKKITGLERKDHLFKDIENLRIDNQLLDEIMEMNGHCLWPIWHVSSKFIAQVYSLPITSGVIGARLGGHNGFPSMGTRSQKITNSIHLASPKLISETKITHDIKNSLCVPEKFWFTSEKGHRLFSHARINTNDELYDTLEQYIQSYTDFSTAIEKFNYDHVSRQYMMKQPSMAKNFLGYYSPLSHPDLLNIVYDVPFKSRVHNRFTQKIIAILNPDLLQFPMAATLIKAKRAILVQELSRILRILLERVSKTLNRENPKLGWFNYEHLYSEGIFSEIIDSLNSDLWSKENMKNIVATNPEKGIDAGSTLDMLCKIKTVDYYLSQVNT